MKQLNVNQGKLPVIITEYARHCREEAVIIKEVKKARVDFFFFFIQTNRIPIGDYI